MITFETKRAAVRKYLEESPHIQDFLIAERCHVLEAFVASERKFLGISPAPQLQRKPKTAGTTQPLRKVFRTSKQTQMDDRFEDIQRLALEGKRLRHIQDELGLSHRLIQYTCAKHGTSVRAMNRQRA